MIAIDQDTLGRQATCYRDNGNYQIWVKTLSNNEKAICLLNNSDEKKSVLVDFALLGSDTVIRKEIWRFPASRLDQAEYPEQQFLAVRRAEQEDLHRPECR